MAGGRPSEYTPEYNKKAIHYLEHFKEYDDVIPSIAGLACAINISKKTIYLWGAQNAEFLHTLEAIAEKQEKVALNNGITGEFNSTITKLVLANHGYHDKVETKTQFTFESLTDDEIKQKIQSILNEPQ